MSEESPKENEQFVLGQLLQKRRSSEKREKVNRILQSDLSIKKKIASIGALDKPAPIRQRKPEEQNVGEIDIPPAMGDSITRYEKLRDGLKSNLPRVGFVRYLITYSRKVFDFGLQTTIFVPSFLRMRLTINPKVPAYFQNQFINDFVTPLQSRLEPILEDAWKYLDKEEYNYLSLLDTLLAELKLVRFSDLNYRNIYTIDRFKRVENIMLCFTANETLTKFKEIFEVLSSANSAYDAKRLFHLSKMIIDENAARPSLINFLVGLNILKSRTFVRFADFMQRQQPHFVSTEEFDCRPPVQKKINEFIQLTQKKLGPLTREASEVTRTKTLIESGTENEILTKSVTDLYKTAEHDQKSNFDRGQENILVFSFRLSQRFLAEFSDLLSGEIDILDRGVRRIFEESLFSVELDRIRHISDKLERHHFKLPVFQLKRFAEIKNLGKAATQLEADVIFDLDELFSSYYQLASKIVIIVEARSQIGASEPIDALALKGKKFSVSSEDGIIVDDGYLQSKTVI